MLLFPLLLGSTFLYSTHAFTLLSAVLERAAERRFLDLMTSMFNELGMLNTVPDENDPLIYHRSRSESLLSQGFPNSKQIAQVCVCNNI